MEQENGLQTTAGTTPAGRMVTANAASVLGSMTQADFDRRLSELRAGADRVRQIQKAIMTEGEDFGTIPNTNKPTLLKPGAEKLLQVFGLVADPVATITYGNNVDEPAVTVITRTMIRVGDMEGPVVAVGVGACSTHEKKYRYRAGERACPSCGALKTLMKKKDFGDGRFVPGWLCYAKRGGCGDTFDLNDPSVVSQKLGEIENPDPYELLNTVLKMSAKRSILEGTLRATASSSVFTQDMDEDPGTAGEEGASGAQTNGKGSPAAAGRPAQPKPTSAAQAPAQAPAQTAAPKIKASKVPGRPLDEMDADEVRSEITMRAAEIADDTPGLVVGEVVARYSYRDDSTEGRRTIADMGKASLPWLRYTLNNLRLGVIPRGGSVAAEREAGQEG